MPGSFCSRGAMKLYGYHVPPAAAGATAATLRTIEAREEVENVRRRGVAAVNEDHRGGRGVERRAGVHRGISEVRLHAQ